MALVGAPRVACGQGAGAGVTEVLVGVTGIAATRSFVGGEVGIARRPPGQGRLLVTAAAGEAAGAAAVRVALAAHFLLWPAARTGVSPYGGLGLAFQGARKLRGQGFITALLGVEAAPGRRRGWFAELGLGGGVRAAVGLRWRDLPPGW